MPYSDISQIYQQNILPDYNIFEEHIIDVIENDLIIPASDDETRNIIMILAIEKDAALNYQNAANEDENALLKIPPTTKISTFDKSNNPNSQHVFDSLVVDGVIPNRTEYEAHEFKMVTPKYKILFHQFFQPPTRYTEEIKDVLYLSQWAPHRNLNTRFLEILSQFYKPSIICRNM